MSEISEIYNALKQLQTSNVKNLRILLQNEYSVNWCCKNIELKSISKTIIRKLEILIEMNLVQKNKVGKENIYSIINNFPVQSNAPKLINQLSDIIKEDKSLFTQAQKPLRELMNEIKSPYYIRANCEDISSKEIIIKQLEFAINETTFVNVNYKNKQYTVKPLKIAEFEGIWYLLLFYDKDNSFRKFRIMDIDEVLITNEQYIKTDSLELKISQWHNVWHNPNIKPTFVKLWIDNSKVQFLEQKNLFNISNHPNRITKCTEGIEYILYITHPSEILSDIMYWQPHIIILEEEGNLNIIEKFNKILEKTINHQNTVFEKLLY